MTSVSQGFPPVSEYVDPQPVETYAGVKAERDRYKAALESIVALRAPLEAKRLARASLATPAGEGADA